MPAGSIVEPFPVWKDLSTLGVANVYRCDGKGLESRGSFDAATVIAAAKMGDGSNVLAVIY